MGYVSSNERSGAEQSGACDAHVLLEGDYSPRRVRWCGFCAAWLCDLCWGSPWRRAQAAAKRLMRN